MTPPAKRVSMHLGVLPEPVLVCLSEAEEEHSGGDGWRQYGGRVDLASGVIAFPPRSLPPCSIPDCHLCETEGQR